MKKCLLILSITMFAAVLSAAESITQKYSCAMHPEIVTDEPANCPRCGMALQVEKPAGQDEVHPTSSSHNNHCAHEHHGIHNMGHAEMRSSINLAEPMNRESSGTSWIPDSSPMYGRMFMFGEDMLMLHGAIFPRYVNANTRRGDDRVDGPNWFMAMYSHPIGENAQLGFRGMMSWDLITERGSGYPLLFQTGETWNGEALHDRQHPHDLFDEISISYSQKLTRNFSAYLYAGYPGEPALGPPAFMHRPSAMDDPDAPLSHHWQDSTHITFGVVTLGLVWRDLKIEGSTFTGREPDEVRYDFDEPRLDSFSGRISWNPTRNLALQVSHGYLHSPEELEPEVNQHRTTASLIYNIPLGRDSNWSSSFVWGQNRNTGSGKTQSFLFETNFQRGRDTFYGRFEHIEKPGHELVLDEIDHDTVFPINAFSVGYVRDITHGRGIDVGLGGQITIHDVPDRLDYYYGDETPFTFQVFLRVRPSLMSDHGGNDETKPLGK